MHLNNVYIEITNNYKILFFGNVIINLDLVRLHAFHKCNNNFAAISRNHT